MPTGKSTAASSSSLGRAVIKSRDKKPTARRSKKADENIKGGAAGEITTNSSSTYSEKRDKGKSIVEENDLEEFLAKADLAGTTFEAEYMNARLISADDNKLIGGTTTSSSSVMIAADNKEKIRQIEDAHETLKSKLRIPRRPKWTPEMSANEVQTNENRAFLEWRRELASLEQEEHILMTPFERNLEVWRQLWRVVERSDVVVQIVDARNPLLFRCLDLERYVKEVDERKVNFILVNKSDLLTPKQRRIWAEYFQRERIAAAFWSAAEPDEDSSADPKPPPATTDDEDDEENTTTDNNSNNDDESDTSSTGQRGAGGDSENNHDLGRIITKKELLQLLKSLRPAATTDDDKTAGRLLTIGMVGYPNVGKSSTINKLIGEKKVAVSATPGKTKHFQTLFLRENDDDADGDEEAQTTAEPAFCLCDCPGLVMPSFVFSKEQMIVSGILPADEMRSDGVPAVRLICSEIDRATFERCYGLILPKSSSAIGEFEDNSDDNENSAQRKKPPPIIAEELLTAYAFLRGFMNSKGIPDSSRAARIIIKDYINGARLRYCHAPPGVDQIDFSSEEKEKVVVDEKEEEHEKTKIDESTAAESENVIVATLRRRHLLSDKRQQTKDFDRSFFTDTPGMAHVKSSKKALVDAAGPNKSGKKYHHNKNKKEKLRRVYGHLDA